ncbi:hypothetical protein WG66_012952 [Moniliophthora roreri]|nr:hypothetical protein WG66_012952 [Moniliophthora roreri]
MGPSLTSLPSEVLLLILYQLDIYHILLLRQTCTRLADFTRDKAVWLSLLHIQQHTLPLPRALRRGPSDYVDALAHDELEAIVTSNQLVDDLWLLPRNEQDFAQLQPRRGDYLIGLEVFMDRWVLGVYGDAWLNMWDLDLDGRWSSHRISVGTGREKVSSYIARLDEERQRVTLVIAGAHPQATYLYEIVLSGPASGSSPVFNALHKISLASFHIVQEIDTSREEYCLAFSRLSSIQLVRWPTHGNSNKDPDSCFIRTEMEELDEMYTFIHAIQFMHPYLLVLKTRSVEAHPIPSSFQPTTPQNLPTLRHNIPKYNFREVRVAAVDTRSRTIKFLASDVIQGLFYFVAKLTLEGEPMLDVRLECVYPMSHGISYRQPREDEVLDTPTNHVRSPFFVSAYALGSQGVRGAWIERRRGSMEKNIIACRFAPRQPLDIIEDDVDTPELLDGQVIYKFRSYDLNEDLMHCALGEVGGKIIVGNRAGNVYLLDIGG